MSGTISIIATFTCSECDAEEKRDLLGAGGHGPLPWSASYVLMEYAPPVGWNVINGRLVCPKHEIVVKEASDE